MSASSDWQIANQQYLMTAVAQIRRSLEHKANQPDLPSSDPDPAYSLAALANHLSPSPALVQLCQTFGLSNFEQELLLLCAGMELDATFPALCALAQGDPQKQYPTFSLALSLFPDAYWSALAPNGPLRRWRLLEVGAGGVLTLSPLRIDERILHYLAGVDHLDERLVGLVSPLQAAGTLVPSHQAQAQQIADIWTQVSDPSQLPVVQLCGDEVASKRAIALTLCEILGLRLHSIALDALPSTLSDLNQLVQLWDREAILSASVLLIDCDDSDGGDRNLTTLTRLLENLHCPILISSYARLQSRQRPLITLDITKPTAEEQRYLWYEALGDDSPPLKTGVEQLVSQFNLTAPAIQAACATALGQLGNDFDEDHPPSLAALTQILWNACRIQARPRLDDLAQRIEAKASWEDLVLPETQLQTLMTVVAHVRQRATVYENWGFASRGDRGLGISALFAGPSGTGKTTAAEVVAAELNLDLYRIDLSSVVSKYIGETEKNLRRVFDAAEGGGAILLFDEADALFGKRSDVKDSHDRHANIEVSYLLQRMEAYRGLAILTTNLKGALDSAFLRRIRFVVQFPFPDVAQRAEIWRRVFPEQTPTEDLNVHKLAKLGIAGGNIRNMALNAAFLAADAGEPVSMKHLLDAARSEHTKLEKQLIEAEIKGWV